MDSHIINRRYDLIDNFNINTDILLLFLCLMCFCDTLCFIHQMFSPSSRELVCVILDCLTQLYNISTMMGPGSPPYPPGPLGERTDWVMSVSVSVGVMDFKMYNRVSLCFVSYL